MRRTAKLWLNRLVIASMMAAVSGSAPLPGATAGELWGHALTPPQQTRCRTHYAGHCDPRDPCFRFDLRKWRYGGQRDFECFALDE